MLELLHNCLRNRNLRVAKPRAFHMWVGSFFSARALSRVEKPKNKIVVDLIADIIISRFLRFSSDDNNMNSYLLFLQ